MQTSAPSAPPTEDHERPDRAMPRLLAYLPRGNTLDERQWRRRHVLLQWVLLLHLPGMAGLGLLLGNTSLVTGACLFPPLVCLVLGHLIRTRRLASFFVTGGLVFCSAGLVVLTSGSIEAHFHFFIIIGFIALYQDWVPFLWNVAFTVISHGIGTIWLGSLIFAHQAGQENPWLWSAIHGIGVLAACVGMVIFWRITEDEQTEKESLGRKLLTADLELGRRRFTSEMLVNLARRNQSMLYRQLDIINQLEEKEQDPDALADLFTLDHLATRVRRNAESLLVLAGEQPPRTWSAPVPLRDVVRAAIAETEDLDRVVFAVDDGVAVSGQAVADLTHLLAELTENAVRFSPPDTVVTIRARPDRRDDGGHLLTIEDWGVGMPPADIAAANELLASPREVDLAVAQRLGFHVVARLAARHRIAVSLGNTPGSGITAVVALPAALFAGVAAEVPPMLAVQTSEARPYATGGLGRHEPPADPAPAYEATGWAEPLPAAAATRTAQGTGVFAASPVATAVPPPGRFQVAGAPEGGWRNWWAPEAASGHGHHTERIPVGGFAAPDDAGVPALPVTTAHGPSPSPRSAPAHVAGRQPADPDIPAPRQAASAPAPAGDGRRPGLRRRVPQAHLAPELRHASADEAPDAAVPPDGAAASALSRYQASRQAAQAVVDGNGHGGVQS